jgi:hypothetical protein
MTTRHVAVAGAIVAIAAGLALGGCRGGGAHPAGSSSPTAMSQAQLLALGHEYAQCIRQHGIPDFPDMVVIDGRLSLPAATGNAAKMKLANNRAAQVACKSIEDRMPDTGPHHSRAPLPPAEIHKRIQWAQCMRQHGVPDWPDPDPNGEFHDLPAQKTPAILAAMNSCKQFEPSGDGRKG